MMRVASLIVSVLLLAGCEAPAVPDGTPVPGHPDRVFVTPPDNLSLRGEPVRLTVDGVTYLAELRQVDVTPRGPLVDDDPTDDIITVQPMMLVFRTDVAVSRLGSPFDGSDAATALPVARAACESAGLTVAESHEQRAPEFVQIKAANDSNEWIFPGLCSEMHGEAA